MIHKLQLNTGRFIELDEQDFPLKLFIATEEGVKIREIKLTHTKDERGFRTEKIHSCVMN